jgi:hypothetical protein
LSCSPAASPVVVGEARLLRLVDMKDKARS